jgi:glycosyltransferase involved in cell wall biosynthesis
MADVDICMIVDNDVMHDARVCKEASSLAAHGWRVVVVGVSRNGPVPERSETVNRFRIERVIARLGRSALGGKPGHILRTIEGYTRAAWKLRAVNAQVYHAHDFTGLCIVALAGIWRRPVVYDSHEFYFGRPLTRLTRWLKPLLVPLERGLAQRASRMIATTESRAAQFAATLGVHNPTIVRNAVDIRSLTGERVPLESPCPHVIVHSGWLTPGRHLPELVRALALLPVDCALAFVGNGPLEVELIALAEKLGVRDRLILVGRVLPQEMIGTLAQATIDVVLITSQVPSYWSSLPNKFFEAVAAGLPLVASPIPEVKRAVETYDIGVLCDPTDPQSIADAIKTALEPDNLARLQANVARARLELNWEAEERKLVQMYETLFAEEVRSS